MIFWNAGPADSGLLGPTILKNFFTIFFFSYPPISTITTGPTEMVHLSMSAELNKEYNYRRSTNKNEQEINAINARALRSQLKLDAFHLEEIIAKYTNIWLANV